MTKIGGEMRTKERAEETKRNRATLERVIESITATLKMIAESS